MKSGHLLLLSSFFGVAAAWVAWNNFHSDLPEESDNSAAAFTSNKRVSPPRPQADDTINHRRPEKSPFNVREMLTLDENASIQSQENLSRLKTRSERRLRLLKESLFLSPDQSQQIYGLIARSSPLFTPGISINGSNPPALSPAVATGEMHDLLDPDQQEDFVDDLLAEKEWWDDLVVDLEAEIDADLTPSTPGSPSNQEMKSEEEQIPFNLFKTLSE